MKSLQELEYEKIATENDFNVAVKRMENLIKEFGTIKEKLDSGIIFYSLREKCLPFNYIIHIISDSQTRYARFIRQGAIMGMIDFLVKHKEHEYVKPYFEQMISARAQMISSDEKMSFFEVRVPKSCTIKEYADILNEVLHCVNPSITYCDTFKLMTIAEKEIPGIMDLLVNYPLRLIDTGNEIIEGFYSFEPYRHVMWYQYTPPMDTGKVTKRYHEVLDMTVPNSSGLNVRLFTDPYAAIPVMFHEYCHYMEDPNEASVFLRTYVFSKLFYQKYRDANPENDTTFVTLYRLFGNQISPNTMEQFNELILKYYGKPLSIQEAREKSQKEIQIKNNNVNWHNINEKWCPEIKYPFLNKEEDEINAKMIAEIIIRYSLVPKTITKKEFSAILKNYMPTNRNMREEWEYQEVEKFNPSVVDKEGRKIVYYPIWENFKNWCIEKKYIKKYMNDNDLEEIGKIVDDIVSQEGDANTTSDVNYAEMIQKLFGGKAN